ncbi:MAG: tetratricopeptide repeat protein [Gammaproteobacteria bacterium]|nr:tetratricopeptide repeat protein [Gammaproteobacteria bacterium]
MRLAETADIRAVLVITFILAILCGTYLVYMPGQSGPLILDDFAHLVPIVDESGEDPAYLWHKYGSSSSGRLGRPVAMASFIVDAVAHGPDISAWKRTSILLHLVCGLLVAWFSCLILTASGQRDRRSAWAVSAVLAGIWLLHPLQVSTVLYLVQRMTELSTLMVLIALICYMHGRLQQVQHGSGGWLSIAAAFFLFFPLAVLSKESALLFPIYCAVAEFVFFRLHGSDQARKIIYTLFAGILFAHAAIGIYLLINFSDFVLEPYGIREFTFAERVLTQPRVIVLYLSQLLLPSQRKMGFFHDDFPVSHGLADPLSTIPSILLVIVLIGSAVRMRKRVPLYAFGVLFFFASHLLESTVFALEMVFEHRNYLASLGIFIAGFGVLQHFTQSRKWMVSVSIVCLLGLSFLTSQRIETWTSSAGMFQYMYFVHPDSPRLNEIAANMNSSAGNYDAARENLEKLNNSLARGLQNLLIDCEEFGRIAPHAITRVTGDESARISGHVVSALDLLVHEVSQSDCEAPVMQLVDLIDHVLALPARTVVDSQTLLIGKARLMEFTGQADAAVAVLETAHKLRPDDALPLYIAARVLVGAGRLDEAVEPLLAAAAIESRRISLYRPISTEIYKAAGNAYLAMKDYARALEVFEAALSVESDDLDFRLGNIEALIGLGRRDEALDEITRVQTTGGPNVVEHRRALGRLEELLQPKPSASVGVDSPAPAE